jgi:hypothetical protein
MIKHVCFNTFSVLLLLTSFQSVADKAALPVAVNPAQEIVYKNKAYHFSFAIPVGWERQSGHPHADNASFMQIPISNSCSFQFNVIPMPATFSAEFAATTFLATAYHELRLNKLTAVKRRDTWIKEKVKEQGKTKERIAIWTRGWEITEKKQPQKQQRIIYQVYDRESHYFNFVAAATSVKFNTCAPELHKIIDSISFLPL